MSGQMIVLILGVVLLVATAALQRISSGGSLVFALMYTTAFALILTGLGVAEIPGVT